MADETKDAEKDSGDGAGKGIPSFKAELTRDTVTDSDKPTGLGKVLVQKAGESVSGSIAILSLNAIARAAEPKREKDDRLAIRVLVTSDEATLADLDVYREVEEERKRLVARLGQLSSKTAPATGVPASTSRRAVAAAVPAATSLIGPMLDGAANALGFATKLFAHDYRRASQEVAVDGLGIEVDVAGKLVEHKKEDEDVSVQLARFSRTPKAKVVANVASLADKAALEVAPRVVAFDEPLAEATAAVAADQAAIKALDEQLAALVEHLDDKGAKALAELQRQRETLGDALAGHQRTVAEQQGEAAPWAALLEDIMVFHALMHARGEAGADALIIRAARGERLAAKDGFTHVLYARATAGGVDETLDTKVLTGKDRWQAFAGLSAEFVLVDAEGELLLSNVISGLTSYHVDLGHPERLDMHDLGWPPKRSDP